MIGYLIGGLFRDVATADALLQTRAPAVAAKLAVAQCPLLWLTTDYFLTLHAREAPLQLLCRLWDQCFLHGPRAVFAGILALLSRHPRHLFTQSVCKPFLRPVLGFINAEFSDESFILSQESLAGWK